MGYPVIDMNKTGQRLKLLGKQHNTSVREIQQYLGLASVQSIYDWYHARTLPSLDHLLALSYLWRTSMENMLVIKEERSSVL